MQKLKSNHTDTHTLNQAVSNVIESAFTPLDEEARGRVLSGELPYWDSETKSVIFKSPYLVEHDGDMFGVLPTENSLEIGLNGCCRVITWNAIDEETFNELISGCASLEMLRHFIAQNPYASAIQGRMSGGSVGGVHGYAKTYKAFSGLDSVVHHIPLKLDNLPIKQISFPIEGMYVLFSVDDYIATVGGIDIPRCEFDEKNLHLYVDRLRFGDIYFDLIKMRYLSYANDKCKAQFSANGQMAFVLDPNGFMHDVFLVD